MTEVAVGKAKRLKAVKADGETMELEVKAGGNVVSMEQLRKPNGAEPANTDELVSVMNAKALAEDNAALRKDIALLEEKMVVLTAGYATLSGTVRGMQQTIAVAHAGASNVKTELDAHIRDEHGGG